mmetsp:Transcript_7665/g.21487  ORF Transcript_7665/g.21487 Transcript_7665/m.21487 type:complete len:377 (+) Transcript_7665:128-1258(+)
MHGWSRNQPTKQKQDTTAVEVNLRCFSLSASLRVERVQVHQRALAAAATRCAASIAIPSWAHTDACVLGGPSDGDGVADPVMVQPQPDRHTDRIARLIDDPVRRIPGALGVQGAHKLQGRLVVDLVVGQVQLLDGVRTLVHADELADRENAAPGDPVGEQLQRRRLHLELCERLQQHPEHLVTHAVVAEVHLAAAASQGALAMLLLEGSEAHPQPTAIQLHAGFCEPRLDAGHGDLQLPLLTTATQIEAAARNLLHVPGVHVAIGGACIRACNGCQQTAIERAIRVLLVARLDVCPTSVASSSRRCVQLRSGVGLHRARANEAGGGGLALATILVAEHAAVRAIEGVAILVPVPRALDAGLAAVDAASLAAGGLRW